MKTYEDILHFYKGIYSTSTTSTEKPVPNPLMDAINTVLPKTETTPPSSSLRDLARISVGSVMLRTYLGKHYLYEDRCLSLDEVKNLTIGTKVWCSLQNDKTDWCIGTIYKNVDETYIITDVFNGMPPGGWHCKEGEWKKYGKYSWAIAYPKDLGIGVKLAEDYLETTLTKDSRPGKFEVSHEGEKYSVLDTNLSLDEVKNLTIGTKVWCNLKTDITDWCIGTIFKDSKNTFIVTDVFIGSYPENGRYHDWRKYGKFTWLVKITNDLGRGVKLVEVENVKKYTKTEGHSGVLSKTEVNRDLFNRLGVQLGHVKVENNPSLTYDKPNTGDALTILKEVKSSTSDNYYSLVKFGDNKFCVINSKNIQ